MVIHEVPASLQLHAVPLGILSQLLHHLSLVSLQTLELFLTLMQTFANSLSCGALMRTSTYTADTRSECGNDQWMHICSLSIYLSRVRKCMCWYYDFLVKIDASFWVSFKRWPGVESVQSLSCVSPNYFPHEVSLSREARQRWGTSWVRNMKVTHLNMRLRGG